MTAAGDHPEVLVRVAGAGVDAPGGRAILDGVDLEVCAGETIAVVGPNGAGKSTLLALLAGDRAPDRGTVTGPDGPLARQHTGDLARFRAVMLQEHVLSFPFEVEDVVRMGRAPWRGRPEEELDDLVVAAAVDTAQVRHLATRRFPTLSGGEKARASFARALAQTPTLLLLDEPTAALDIRHQERVLAMARRHAADGGAVVVVLHDLALAAAYADRLVLLDEGTVAAQGDPAHVLTAERLSRVYDHPVEVVPHPTGAGLIVLPVRLTAAVAPAAEPAQEDLSR